MDAVQHYLQLIAAYDRDFKKWESRVKDILEVYRDDKYKTRQTAKFNILWSNVQTLVPATYARIPKPDVSRRFRDNDPVGRVASLILERALEYELQHYADFPATMRQSVTDRFLGGRGTAWARYEPHIRQVGTPYEGDQVTEDVDVAEELEYECAPTDYVHWKDFGHSVARTWEEVTTVWRMVYMTRDGCIERFGKDVGSKIPLDSKPDDQKKNQEDTEQSRALIYEIWDKETKRACWLSKSLGQIVDEKDDPLGLEGFFPCPKPLFATLTNESLVPVPDYALYQDQAQALDIICDRIDGLIKALQVKGVYNAEFPELGRLFTEGENNTLIPVKNFAAFAEKQGLKGAVDMLDITPVFKGLQACYQAMEEQKQQIYDITGLSDIVRGQSVASETATAQQIKGQYASMRLNSMKSDVAQYATEILQLKAQIMCAKFDPQTLLQISAADQLSPQDQQLIPQAIQLLKQNPIRSFRIEIASDSMIQIDEQAEKEARTEFISAVGQYLEKTLPVVQEAPQAAPLVLELFKFGVTAFKVGRSIEGVIDETLDNVRQQLSQPQPPKPDPEMAKVQAQQQAEQARAQADAQNEQARIQAQLMIEQARARADMQIEQQRMQMEARFEAERQAREMESKRVEAAMNAQLEMLKARLDAQTRIAVAEISADATLTAQQADAANREGDS